MRSAKTVALVAGAGFFLLALLVQGIYPYVSDRGRADRPLLVSRTVRTGLGQLALVPAPAPPPAALVASGRKIFLREGCWYCHSQYIRPAAGEERRWGPPSEFGEYANDLPHLLGTRRIGPDLLRVGGKYGDDWHAAHYFDPRIVVPDSIMPRFDWFFRKDPADGRQILTEEGASLVAFVQSLGMSRGKWRDAYPYQIFAAGAAAPESAASLRHGQAVYLRRCVGCHGVKGDGKGAAPTLVRFDIALPRDFTAGVFKFRTTPTGSLPLDSDLYRTITVGIRGAAMPPWFNLPESDRIDVIHYIKTFAKDFQESPPEAPIAIPPPPAPTREIVAHGKEVFEEMKCWECHGHGGRGDGEKAATLKDDEGNRIRPANLTTGIFKSGPRVEDIFRTFMTGLSGTPMPSFADSFTAAADGWALGYFVLSLSADAKP